VFFGIIILPYYYDCLGMLCDVYMRVICSKMLLVFGRHSTGCFKVCVRAGEELKSVCVFWQSAATHACALQVVWQPKKKSPLCLSGHGFVVQKPNLLQRYFVAASGGLADAMSPLVLLTQLLDHWQRIRVQAQ
jgi:hypothetical protein